MVNRMNSYSVRGCTSADPTLSLGLGLGLGEYEPCEIFSDAVETVSRLFLSFFESCGEKRRRLAAGVEAAAKRGFGGSRAEMRSGEKKVS